MTEALCDMLNDMNLVSFLPLNIQDAEVGVLYLYVVCVWCVCVVCMYVSILIVWYDVNMHDLMGMVQVCAIA